MRQRDKQAPLSAEETVRDIRRATRRHFFSAEEKIRIVLDGRAAKAASLSSAARKVSLKTSTIRWSKECLESETGDTAREAAPMRSRRFAPTDDGDQSALATDFTYLKVTGWSWFSLDGPRRFSRYNVAWKLCTTIESESDATRSSVEPSSKGAANSAHRL